MTRLCKVFLKMEDSSDLALTNFRLYDAIITAKKYAVEMGMVDQANG